MDSSAFNHGTMGMAIFAISMIIFGISGSAAIVYSVGHFMGYWG